MHVLEMTEDDWCLQHPLECRPNLLGCDVNVTLRETITTVRDQHGFGRHAVTRTEAGLRFERVAP